MGIIVTGVNSSFQKWANYSCSFKIDSYCRSLKADFTAENKKERRNRNLQKAGPHKKARNLVNIDATGIPDRPF